MRKYAWKTVVPVALAIVIGGIAASAFAQQEYVGQVRAQLDGTRRLMADEGYEKTHDYRIGDLANGRSDSFTVTLRKGWEYVLTSVCDNDCSDLDIKVFDENNNQIAEDKEVDDAPIVEVTPKWTGQFRIQVTMYQCSDDPCYFGLAVFGK